jgi:phosphoserine phosphatase SerB
VHGIHCRWCRPTNNKTSHQRFLVAFDMDGTLVDGRLVFAVADRLGLSDKVRQIQENPTLLGYEQSESIARLFKGLSANYITEAIESLSLMRNCEKVVEDLKEQGHILGIISDSYDIAVNYVANKLKFDFSESNCLELDSNGKLTGNIKMPLGWQKNGCYCKISVCKRYCLRRNTLKFQIGPGRTVAIGDTKSDLCMVEEAALGVAFMPKHRILEERADLCIHEPNLAKLGKIIASL